MTLMSDDVDKIDVTGVIDDDSIEDTDAIDG